MKTFEVSVRVTPRWKSGWIQRERGHDVIGFPETFRRASIKRTRDHLAYVIQCGKVRACQNTSW